MKKLLKFIGKILAIPFSIAITILKMCLVPLVIIRELLKGNIDTLKKKRAFTKDMVKFCMDHYKENKPFTFSAAVSYGDSKKIYSFINAKFYRDNTFSEVNDIISECSKTEK